MVHAWRGACKNTCPGLKSLQSMALIEPWRGSNYDAAIAWHTSSHNRRYAQPAANNPHTAWPHVTRRRRRVTVCRRRSSASVLKTGTPKPGISLPSSTTPQLLCLRNGSGWIPALAQHSMASVGVNILEYKGSVLQSELIARRNRKQQAAYTQWASVIGLSGAGGGPSASSRRAAHPSAPQKPLSKYTN